MKLFISPHNDDEALFGAATILREKPLVLIVTDSARQTARGTGITAAQRRLETLEAMRILGAQVHFLGIPDNLVGYPGIDLQFKFQGFLSEHCQSLTHVYLPAKEIDGNDDHNAVSELYVSGFTDKQVTRYLTYTKAGKSRSEHMVPFERDWPLLKLKALACYKSQILEPSTRDHFLREQYEYYA